MKLKLPGLLKTCALSLLVPAIMTATLSSSAVAGHRHTTKKITVIHLSDVHGHIRPHDEDFISGRNSENAGGVAKLATGIKEIRERDRKSVV